MKLCIVQPNRDAYSETFLRAQAERLPMQTTVLYGRRPFCEPATLADSVRYLQLRARRYATGKSKDWEFTEHCKALFAKHRPDAVLAQFGFTGIRLLDACEAFDIPLIVNFRGGDATRRARLDRQRDGYQRLWHQAAALVGVSHSIRQNLIARGAPEERVHWNPSGADCDSFFGSEPGNAEPTFIAAGRFVDKKAPHLTIQAFSKVVRQRPSARLCMIGDGPLLDFCKRLVHQLRLDDAVTFAGAQPHEVVQQEMRRARGFVQHSVVARDGNSEGTPVAVMEAGASGLPVVATRHAGINDVVIDEETGLLVDEHDVVEMSHQITRLIDEPGFAQQLGEAARKRVVSQFSQKASLQRITDIIRSAVTVRRGEESPRKVQAA